MIAAVFAADLNNAIGKNNALLCHLPADLQFFKKVTMGSPVIMGRKTYESIGRLLPGRRNLIITRKTDYRVLGAEVFHSIEHALAACPEENVFIIGGADIFRQSIDSIDTLYKTVIQHKFEADTWFPKVPEGLFHLAWEEHHSKDEKNPYDYTFQRWERNAK